MNTKVAKVNWLGNEVEIRSGAKGTGRKLYACNYRNDSPASVEQAEVWIGEAIATLRNQGVEVKEA